jgi:hypothetical protein
LAKNRASCMRGVFARAMLSHAHALVDLPPLHPPTVDAHWWCTVRSE